MNLEIGRIYIIKSRNLSYGIFDGNGFIGIRTKFHSRFLDKEVLNYTAFVEKETDIIVPYPIKLTTGDGAICSKCEQFVMWDGNRPSNERWYHLTKSDCPDRDFIPYHNSNTVLFKFLDDVGKNLNIE
jgi:hypothetical protein